MQIEVYYPDAQELSEYVRLYGINAFKKAVPMRLRCCEIRKVNPLKKVLDGLDAWITGLRRDQWASRSNIRKMQSQGQSLMPEGVEVGWTPQDLADLIEYIETADAGSGSK